MLDEAVRVTPLTIAGAQVGDGELLSIRSPWDGRLVGQVPLVGAEQTRAAITAAVGAMKTPLTAAERGQILDDAAALVRQKTRGPGRHPLRRSGKTSQASPGRSGSVRPNAGILRGRSENSHWNGHRTRRTSGRRRAPWIHHSSAAWRGCRHHSV